MLPTAPDSVDESDGGDQPIPGAVVVWSDARPFLRALRVAPGGLELGRETLAETGDDRLSRQHARVTFGGGRFQVADLGSRNGTHVQGAQVTGDVVTATAPVIVRAGRTVLILVDDVRGLEHATVATDGAVVGPTLRRIWDDAERAARSGRSLLVTGESGTGKELVARAFHRAGGGGELVAINCAAIPAGLAERLLFGVRKGAFSGADRDADGYLAAADGGTLFLDEIAELDREVQAKLLRVLETGELIALGAARARPVSLRVVAATLRELRAEVEAGRFRDDLYYRIGRPELRVPPLRERPEEVPWLIAGALAERGVTAHAGFVEACLLRPWPGNLRELLGEVARAGHAAAEAGRPQVRAEDLADDAGRARPGAAPPLAAAPPAGLAPVPAPAAPLALPDDAAAIDAALAAEGGNVTRAARRLNVHRNQLRRYLARAAPPGAATELDDGDQ